MAAHSTVVVSAIAQQLLAEVDTYESHLVELAANGWDTSALLILSEQAELVTRCAQCLPGLAVAHAQFLITATSLAHALYAKDLENLDRLHGEHLGALLSVRRAGIRLLRLMDLVTSTTDPSRERGAG